MNNPNTQFVKISQLKLLDRNPRRITKERFDILCESIKNNPDYFWARPILANNATGENIVYAGNQRLKAAKKLGLKEVPCIIETLTDEQQKERMVRDNVELGEWDFDILSADFDISELLAMGVEVPNVDIKTGDSGNDWNYNYKELEQVGDGLPEKLGFAPHSIWYGIPRDYGDIKNKLVALPERENKNPHQDKYSRTNPESIRRIIKMYMRDGDFFLESCCGWSTFGAIAKYEGYSGIGVDIWDTAIELSKKQIEIIPGVGQVEIKKMDAMQLEFKDDSFDYIYCNPPFMDVEMYSGAENDIATKNRKDFESKFSKLMKENFRVLKQNGLCTITISDQRKDQILIPNQKLVIDTAFLAGFLLHDFVIVEQLGVANMYRKKAYEKRRSPKNHEYVITFTKTT